MSKETGCYRFLGAVEWDDAQFECEHCEERVVVHNEGVIPLCECNDARRHRARVALAERWPPKGGR